MNSVLEEIRRTNQVHPVDGSAPVSLHSAISREEGSFLQDMLRIVDPLVSLEVGLAYGISALYICDALRIRQGSKHIVVDQNQNSGPHSWQGIGLANLRRAGYGDIVHFMEKRSHQALPELELAGQKLDFAFVDGCHLFDFVMVDFFCIDRMLRAGGVVVFDDTDMPAIRKVCRFILTNCSYNIIGSCGAGQTSWKRKAIRRVLKATPLWNYCSPEVRHSDAELRISGSCVAFRKEADIVRPWDHFENF